MNCDEKLPKDYFLMHMIVDFVELIFISDSCTQYL